MKIDCVMVEAGHGLSWGGLLNDNGATYGELTEYAVNCSIAERVVAILKAKQAEEGIGFVQGIGFANRNTNAKKVSFANSVININGFNPTKTLYVCLHCNANTGTPGTGTESYVGNASYKDAGLALGESIRKSLVEYFGYANRGSKTRSLYFQSVKCVGTLIEMGFINNTFDVVCLTDYDRIATAVAHGILEHIRGL